MNWYYAVGGQQQGPVDEAQLDALIAAGQISPDTLVWREGMANWQPLRAARSAPGSAPPVADALSPVAAGANEIVCGECGKAFTRDNAIQYGTTWVCTACKPIFLRKLSDGVSGGGAHFEPTAFLAGLRERDYDLKIGSCLSRGWELVKAKFWLTVGATALVYLCLIAASVVPCIGGIAQLIIQGPLMGGLYWFFLKLVRNQEAGVADAFAGFRMAFSQLFLVTLITGILTFLCMLPGIGTAVAVGAMQIQIPVVLMVSLILVSVIPTVYLGVCWMFSIPLVIDKDLDFWPAMELSRKVISRHWGWMFLFLLVCALVALAGLLALCVGLFVTVPVIMASLAYAYEDIFGAGTQATV